MAKTNTLTPQEIADKAVAVLFSRKAENAILLDLRGLSSLTDFYLICTCQSETQMRAILNAVRRALSKEGIKPLRSEYHAGVRWAVMDFGDLILHLFEKETRTYYSLERLWGDAKATELLPENYRIEEAPDEDEDDDL